MKEKDFKRTFRPPACTKAPWYSLIPKADRDAVMRKIRQETIEAYGYSMDECPKRKTCLTKSCIGRPLPFKSETAKPYLEKLKTTQNIQNEEMFISNCDTCAIAKVCKSPCYQVNDFLERGSTKEPELLPEENLEGYVTVQKHDDIPKLFSINSSDIPWDCLTQTRIAVVKKYLYEGKDFLRIAKELDLNNQARAKYEFYSALTRLSEFAVMRKFLDETTDLTSNQRNILILIYKDNINYTEIAKRLKISKQAVQQTLTRVLEKYNIKWGIFVRKQGNKIIYNVPGLFK